MVTKDSRRRKSIGLQRDVAPASRADFPLRFSFQRLAPALPILLFSNLFIFGQSRILAYSSTVMATSKVVMSNETGSRGMLAVFMQPDSSLDEDEYAPSLNVSEMHDSYQSGFMSGITTSSRSQTQSLPVAPFR